MGGRPFVLTYAQNICMYILIVIILIIIFIIYTAHFYMCK